MNYGFAVLYLNAGVVWVCGAERAGAALLLAVLEPLRLRENGDRLPLKSKNNLLTTLALQEFFFLRLNWQNNREGLVGHETAATAATSGRGGTWR